MEESRGAIAANDSHFSRRRRWRLEYLAGNGCVVFPRLLGWVSTIVNGRTQHRRGRLDTAFSYEKAYETILTLTLTKQALITVVAVRGRHSGCGWDVELEDCDGTSRRLTIE